MGSKQDMTRRPWHVLDVLRVAISGQQQIDHHTANPHLHLSSDYSDSMQLEQSGRVRLVPNEKRLYSAQT